MKKHQLILLLMAGVTAVNTQTSAQLPRWSIGLSAGAAIPSGGGSHVSTAIGTAYIHPGAGAELNVSCRIGQHLALTTAISAQLNNGDGVPYDPDSAHDYRPSWHPNDWKSQRLLGGIAYLFPMTKDDDWTAQLRVMAGAQRTKTADYFDQYGNLNGIKDGFKGTVLPWTFAWTLDAMIQHRLSSRFAAYFNLGYSHCTPSFTRRYLLGDPNLPQYRSPIKDSYSTATLNARIGLTYFFPYSKKISVAP